MHAKQTRSFCAIAYFHSIVPLSIHRNAILKKRAQTNFPCHVTLKPRTLPVANSMTAVKAYLPIVWPQVDSGEVDGIWCMVSSEVLPSHSTPSAEATLTDGQS